MKRVIGLLATIVALMVHPGVVKAGEAKVPPGYLIFSFHNYVDGYFFQDSLEIGIPGVAKKLYAPSFGAFTRLFDDPEGGGGTVVVQKLPPGHYFVRKFSSSVNGLTGELPLQYSFSIESGKVTYIGQFITSNRMAKRLFFTMPSSFTCSVSDKLDRDLAIGGARLPQGLPVLDQAPSQPTSADLLK